MVRTRLMNQPPDAKIYNGFVDCIVKVNSLLLSSSLSMPTHTHTHTPPRYVHAHLMPLFDPCCHIATTATATAITFVAV